MHTGHCSTAAAADAVRGLDERVGRDWLVEEEWREGGRHDICHMHHMRRMCKIISPRVKFYILKMLF